LKTNFFCITGRIVGNDKGQKTPITMPRHEIFVFLADVQSTYKTKELRGRPVKLMKAFAHRGMLVVSATDTQDHILGFVDRSCYFFFQVAPQLYSRG
jgi:hypothetical protein